jgi:hypothetical protein
VLVDVLQTTALVVGLGVSLRALGVFQRADYSIQSSYQRPTATDFHHRTVPRFVVEWQNLGNLPVTFSHFELLEPRSTGVVSPAGEFIWHEGAEFFIDGIPRGRVPSLQAFHKVDFKTQSIDVPPRSVAAEIFEMKSFVDEALPGQRELVLADLDPYFEPVLAFQDSFGHQFHCDSHGVHPGEYVFPAEDALRRAMSEGSLEQRVVVDKNWLRLLLVRPRWRFQTKFARRHIPV